MISAYSGAWTASARIALLASREYWERMGVLSTSTRMSRRGFSMPRRAWVVEDGTGRRGDEKEVAMLFLDGERLEIADGDGITGSKVARAREDGGIWYGCQESVELPRSISNRTRKRGEVCVSKRWQ